MTPKVIFEKLPGLTLVENRYVGDDRVEIVFLNSQCAQWKAHLETFLGPALKPAGVPPRPEDEALAKAYGGIRAGQTLFAKKIGQNRIVAFFWPWQDGVNTTLKMYAEAPE